MLLESLFNFIIEGDEVPKAWLTSTTEPFWKVLSSKLTKNAGNLKNRRSVGTRGWEKMEYDQAFYTWNVGCGPGWGLETGQWCPQAKIYKKDASPPQDKESRLHCWLCAEQHDGWHQQKTCRRHVFDGMATCFTVKISQDSTMPQCTGTMAPHCLKWLKEDVGQNKNYTSHGSDRPVVSLSGFRVQGNKHQLPTERATEQSTATYNTTEEACLQLVASGWSCSVCRAVMMEAQPSIGHLNSSIIASTPLINMMLEGKVAVLVLQTGHEDTTPSGLTSQRATSTSGLTPQRATSTSGLTPQRATSTSGLTPQRATSTSGLTPQRATSTSGLTPQRATSTPGLTPQRATSTPGLTPQRTTSTSGLTPQRATSTPGLTPQRATSTSGLTPQRATSPYGVSPIREGLLHQESHPSERGFSIGITQAAKDDKENRHKQECLRPGMCWAWLQVGGGPVAWWVKTLGEALNPDGWRFWGLVGGGSGAMWVEALGPCGGRLWGLFTCPSAPKAAWTPENCRSALMREVPCVVIPGVLVSPSSLLVSPTSLPVSPSSLPPVSLCLTPVSWCLPPVSLCLTRLLVSPSSLPVSPSSLLVSPSSLPVSAQPLLLADHFLPPAPRTAPTLRFILINYLETCTPLHSVTRKAAGFLLVDQREKSIMEEKPKNKCAHSSSQQREDCEIQDPRLLVYCSQREEHKETRAPDRLTQREQSSSEKKSGRPQLQREPPSLILELCPSSPCPVPHPPTLSFILLPCPSSPYPVLHPPALSFIPLPCPSSPCPVPHPPALSLIPHPSSPCPVPHPSSLIPLSCPSSLILLPCPSSPCPVLHPPVLSLILLPCPSSPCPVPHPSSPCPVPHPSALSLIPHPPALSLIPHPPALSLIPHPPALSLIPHPPAVSLIPNPPAPSIIPHTQFLTDKSLVKLRAVIPKDPEIGTTQRWISEAVADIISVPFSKLVLSQGLKGTVVSMEQTPEAASSTEKDSTLPCNVSMSCQGCSRDIMTGTDQPILLSAVIETYPHRLSAVIETYPHRLSAVTETYPYRLSAVTETYPHRLSAVIETYPHRLSAVIETYPHKLSAVTETYPHRLSAVTETYPHRLSAVTETYPHRLSAVTETYPHRLSAVTETYPHRLSAVIETYPHRLSAVTETYPHRLSAVTETYPHRLSAVTVTKGPPNSEW
ncbi:hypothetical protein P4O66_004411 [Electrophorus voltai]|uniref:Mucin-like domain-containing protein n=1 Tax=Electrophorus voltai TaxID=2609070 RepID=A0AAD9E2L4_9TELE|nr:hypothetical protein P4O66_004411 [Electrophorus voltai]